MKRFFGVLVICLLVTSAATAVPTVTVGRGPAFTFPVAPLSGEFQLTSALDRLRREDGFLGLIMDGRRFDIGLPQYYLETLQMFSQP